jgi:hypothetical protein
MHSLKRHQDLYLDSSPVGTLITGDVKAGLKVTVPLLKKYGGRADKSVNIAVTRGILRGQPLWDVSIQLI